ncbi:MAG: hypothetical protein JNL50_09420 [Phycisphaerae bacterium]|nr:hypothetical protein [Phycisphaerae bacterium]
MPPIDPIVLRVLGIVGSVLIVLGFAVKDRPHKRATAIVNLAGALIFGFTLLYRDSIEGVVLQLIWGTISIKDFVRATKSPSPG